MIEPENIYEEGDNPPNVRTEIAMALFDKDNPELITKVGYNEVDKISILSALVKAENKNV